MFPKNALSIAVVITIAFGVFRSEDVLASKSTTQPAFSFGVIADIQYADVDSPQGRCYRKSEEKLKKCVQAFNSVPLTFAIQLGDMVDRSSGDFATMLSIIKKLKIPVYHAIGNHDVAAEPDRKKLIKLWGTPANYHDFTYNGWRFIVLDTTGTNYKGAPALFQKLKDKNAPNAQTWNGGVDPEQIAWLQARLKKANDDHEKVIVFGHMPLFPINAHNVWNDEEIIGVLESAGCVVAYFNGHNHGGNYGEKNGIHYVNVAGMVETPDQTAYATIDIYADHLEVNGVGRETSRTLKLKTNKDATHHCPK